LTNSTTLTYSTVFQQKCGLPEDSRWRIHFKRQDLAVGLFPSENGLSFAHTKVAPEGQSQKGRKFMATNKKAAKKAKKGKALRKVKKLEATRPLMVMAEKVGADH
jgi:hypothetical protein